MPVIYHNQPRLLDRSSFRAKMQQKFCELEQSIVTLHEEIAAVRSENHTTPSRRSAVTNDHAASREILG